MVNPNRFYTYAYLRKDRTPYYIGKGSGNRASKRKNKDIKPPKDRSRIICLKQNLTEEQAFKHEIYMIAVFGRKDLGTGILHNRTNGGDGVSGKLWTKEDREKKSKEMLGEKNHFYGKNHSEETKSKISLAKSKYKYQFFSPTNEIFIVYNLKSFCLENNLLSSVMYKIASKDISNGKRSLSYKGWKVERLGPLKCISNVSTTETPVS